MKTKFGEITPQVIEDAYLITGYKPTHHLYIHHGTCKACALGVFTHLNDPEALASGCANWIKIRESLGITPNQEDSFSIGFSGGAYDSGAIDDVGAWVTGKACREHLISKGMIP